MRVAMSLLSLIVVSALVSCSGFISASISGGGSGGGSGSGSANSVSSAGGGSGVDDEAPCGYNAKREPLPCDNLCEDLQGNRVSCDDVQPMRCTWDTVNAKREPVTEEVACDDDRRMNCYNANDEEVPCTLIEIG